MVRGAVEPQHCAMQGVTRNDIRMAAVQTIPRQRVAEPGKVNADLMGTARYRKTGNQCMGSAGGQHGVFRHAGLAVFPYTAANDGIAAARNRDVNAARPNGQRAFHQGKITLLCSLGEFRRGKGILRTQHKAAGVFINAVDRAEYAILAAAFQAVQPAVRKGPAGMV